MKPRRSPALEQLERRVTRVDAEVIDELYGLEPVFEPEGAPAARGGTELVTILCPYCWERFETSVDPSGGSATYIEDCEVCCRPIVVRYVVSADSSPGTSLAIASRYQACAISALRVPVRAKRRSSSCRRPTGAGRET